MRDPTLTGYAKTMRKQMTEPETRLWLQLRAKRCDGVKFRRQKVIQNDKARYIVDFAANDQKLVIELDGDTHAEREGYDTVRTGFLEEHGYSVVRFNNTVVMENLDGVLMRLVEIVAEMKDKSPLPTLSPEGERV
jgi:very-short-patch-repair endonuclease